MFGIGTPELIVIMGIAFLLFGGKKLPELGSGLGKGIRAFQSALRDMEDAGKSGLEDHSSDLKEANVLKSEVKEEASLNSTKS